MATFSLSTLDTLLCPSVPLPLFIRVVSPSAIFSRKSSINGSTAAREETEENLVISISSLFVVFLIHQNIPKTNASVSPPSSDVVGFQECQPNTQQVLLQHARAADRCQLCPASLLP